jgi:hypothetical protein
LAASDINSIAFQNPLPTQQDVCLERLYLSRSTIAVDSTGLVQSEAALSIDSLNSQQPTV